MKVQEVMSSDIRSCTPGTNLAEAAAMLWEEDCGALPVVADGKVEGIITDRDICIALGTRDRVPHEMTVAEVESRNPTTCHPNDELSRAMAAMPHRQERAVL
jgi:CBS domain-containing protein